MKPLSRAPILPIRVELRSDFGLVFREWKPGSTARRPQVHMHQDQFPHGGERWHVQPAHVKPTGFIMEAGLP